MAREMKDSGVEWIGEIPKTWHKVRLRFLCNIVTGNKDTQDNDPDGIYPFYVRSPKVEHSNTYTFEGPAILMAGDGVGAGKVFHYVNGKYACHQRVYSLQKIRNINRKLLYYILENRFYYVIECANSKSTVDSVRLNMLQDFPIFGGIYTEQQKIADYLDKKCSQIDTALEKTRASIEEYKKLKQAIITKAVTKGIRGNRPMKDSGIEWIGEIPVDWKVIPSKYLFKNSLDTRHKDDEQLTASQKYGIISQIKYMELQNSKITLANKGLDAWKHVEPNDFIISLRSFQGGLELSEVSGCITWHYIVLRAIHNIHSMYYKWLFKSNSYITALQRTCNYVRDGQDLRYSNFIQVPLCIPSIIEQVEIGEYINKKCTEIDNIIVKKEQLITQLETYKKSLIYEYVTGKKEA